jgi:hypothetical protein
VLFSVLIGVLMKSPQAVQGFGYLLMFPIVFGSNLLVPTSTMPGWLQAFVKVNPVTYLSEAERALLVGGRGRGAVAAVGARHLPGFRPARDVPPPDLTAGRLSFPCRPGRKIKISLAERTRATLVGSLPAVDGRPEAVAHRLGVVAHRLGVVAHRLGVVAHRLGVIVCCSNRRDGCVSVSV